ncbi:PREDICTED: uncharacterized protein LOC109234674 [Nicotiana attenuata]|uniref:uncharacterized protein LOC109234674 n=1 Tax=Nicotiana attenuata TaxID=49451 RepID=UPI0009055E81|nr:PREDICTED: uncharacterized protein LOC109234674 [Nicotiana attenuata]
MVNFKRCLYGSAARFCSSSIPNSYLQVSQIFYGLKQAPRAWYNKLHQFLISETALHLLTHLFKLWIVHSTVRDLGPLHYFLGIQACRNSDGIWLSKSQYIQSILTKAGMIHCKPLSSPTTTSAKLHKGDSSDFDDPSLYRQVFGALPYLTLTRQDITFVASNLYLQALIDSDRAGSIDDRKSTGGYAIYFGPNLISWSSRKQRKVAHSSIESEYKALDDVAA